MEESGVEDGDVRKVGQQSAGDLDTQYRRRVVQRRKRGQLAESLDREVVDDGRPVQVRPAVHDPVTDRDHPQIREVQTICRDHRERGPQSGLVVGDAAGLADALDDPIDDRHPGDRLDQ